MLEFRFEYLWPLWLMIRSVYDSFKFQGLAFSMFFALIALSSDLICFFFIPIHWLFFAASTYVWVQYVWHTDRGVCLPTVSLWLLFVYIEASVRLKELKTPYNLDLCRPFAAHCIGYPVVTLGFGFKSYVSYRLRLRKQREVAKENQFYKELLQQALPQDSLVSVPSMQESNVSCNDLTNGTSNNHSSSPLANSCTVIANGNSVNLSNGHQSQVHHVNSHSHSTTTTSTTNTNKSSRSAHSQVDSGKLLTGNNKSAANESSDQKKSSLSNGDPNSKNSELFIDKQCMEQVNNHQSNNHNHHRSSNKVTNSINDFDEHSDSQVVGHKMPVKTPINATLSKGDVNRKDQVSTPISSLVSSASSSSASTKNNVNNVISSTGHVSEVIPPNPPSVSTSSSGKKRNDKNKDSNIVTNNLLTPNATYKSSVKDELVFKLESEIKKLKADLQSSKANEQELRSRLNQATSDDKGARAEIQALQQNNDQLHLDKENLLAKYNNLVSAMQQEKQSTSMLEKRIQEEKKLNASLESQLNNERKARQKAERSLEHQQSESNASSKASSSRSSQSSMPNSPFSNNTCTNGTSECSSEVCKLKRKEIECEINSLRREMSIREEKIRQMDREAQSLRQYKETQNDTELLMSAFSAMKEKAQHLEYSLSAETRLKLDLFSALGDAKRQLEISHGKCCCFFSLFIPCCSLLLNLIAPLLVLLCMIISYLHPRTALMAKKEKEIDELKSKIAEVMAVMPTTSTAYSPIESSLVSSILFNSSNCKYLHSDAASNTISNSNSNGSHLESALSKVLCEANGTTSLYSPQVVPSDL